MKTGYSKSEKMNPKGSQKGAKSEPKGDQNASKSRPSEKVAKREQNGRTVLCFLAPFWSHFPSKIDEKIDAKIDAEKVMNLHEKSMRK